MSKSMIKDSEVARLIDSTLQKEINESNKSYLAYLLKQFDSSVFYNEYSEKVIFELLKAK